MNKSKKILSGVLAALMLVSMLACFILPATAEEQTNYFVTSVADWNTLAASGIDWTGKTIHIQNDISFEGVSTIGQFDTFAGTLDGHGYKFKGINMTGSASKFASLIVTLTGTVQNLTLDATCTFTNAHTTTSASGAFAATSSGGKIYNCASYATSTATNGPLSGFIGKTDANGATIDGCIFGGSLANEAGIETAFVGNMYAFATVYLKNSVAKGTTAAETAGMLRATTTLDASPIENSYAIGMNALIYKEEYDTDVAAEWEAAYTMTDVEEAAWLINETRKAAEGGVPSVYLNVAYELVDIDGDEVKEIVSKPCFGSAENRVVRMLTTNGETTTTYHAPREVLSNGACSGQTVITPAAVDGKTPVVSGAEYRDGKIYVNHSDITVDYVETAAYELSQKQKQLKEMIDGYDAMDPSYFTDWAAKNEWLQEAKTTLAQVSADKNAGGDPATLTATLQAQITAEDAIDGNVIALADPKDYPSVSEYNIYKYIESITGYRVSTKQDWLNAIEMSNYAENPDAVNFKGVTLHLTNDIDMTDQEMLPLCYSGIFDGNLDGHDYVFRNVNIKVDSAYGPVGLVGVLGETAKRTIQNLGIESGSVLVTGHPRYKSALMSITDAGNKAGCIVGKNHKNNTLIRKCWNNADIKVDNRDSVAGIIGDPRNYAIVDSCFNLGRSDAYGVQGYGRQVAQICNSMSGAVEESAVLYAAGLLTNATYTPENRIINVCGVRNTLKFNQLSDNADTKAEQVAAQNEYNAVHNELSDAAAAWKINANYVQQTYGNGERIYYTLNENGAVRFGKPDGSDQICRIKMVCHEHGAECTAHPVRYSYGVAGRKIALNFAFGANYYACENDGVTIKDNTLVFDQAPQDGTDKSFTVYVGYNADRGNVNGDDKSVINILDVLDAVRLAVTNTDEIALEKLLAADVNSDHTVNIRDAYYIIRYWLNPEKSTCFTPGFSGEKESDYLKILSYNIKSFHYDPNYNVNDSNHNGRPMCRYNAVLSELEKINADIIGLQEIDRYNIDARYNADGLDKNYTYVDQLEMLRVALGMGYSHFFITVPDNDTDAYENDGYGHGILSKYPILESGGEYFAGKGQPSDPAKKLDASEPRGFAWYRIDINNNGADGKDIIYYNCHLANYTAEQLRYVTNHMETLKAQKGDLRIVCTGDFNLNAFEAEGTFDTGNFTVLNGGDGFDQFIRTAVSGSMIDNILVSEDVEYFKPSAYETGLNTSTALYGPENESGKTNYPDEKWSASDHLPIWAYIKK